jgi:hypothetical protein
MGSGQLLPWQNLTTCEFTNDRIAQWISASDFGSEGRGFDSHCGRFSSNNFVILFGRVMEAHTHHSEPKKRTKKNIMDKFFVGSYYIML